MFFKKKPKKSWLEQQMELEQKRKQKMVTMGLFPDVSEKIDDKKFDNVIDAFCAVGMVNVVTANELRNLQATMIDASKIEVVPLYLTPNQVRASVGLPPIKEV